MRRILAFGFLLMGFGFTVTQSLLIRELLVAFFGNELSIGLILGCWLLLEAIGSGLIGRLADRWGRQASSFGLLQVLFALFLPVSLFAAYTSRSLVGAIPGQGVGLIPILVASFLILAPVALVDGAMFAFGVRAYAHLTAARLPSIGRVYVLEAMGGLAGGVVFTYLFIPFLHSLQIVLLLSGLNLLAAALILAWPSPVSTRARHLPLSAGLLLLLIAVTGMLLSPLAGKVQRWVLSHQWPGFDLIYSENSVYGNVAVVQRQSQYTFYADGIPILTAPVPDIAHVEEMVHLPLLFVPEPRRVLVLSGGLGGILHELAKYPLERIDYAELDPLLVEAVQQFPTPLTRGELDDPRLRIEPVDGRLLVRQKQLESHHHLQAGYDLILVNLPYPSTLQLNRFYTVEFFDLARHLLARNGVLVIGSPGTLSYMSVEMRDLNAMMAHTLRVAFPHVRPIPGDPTLWLASTSEELTDIEVEALAARWEQRSLETRLLSPGHIRLRLEPQVLDWFWASLGEGASLVEEGLLPGGTGTRPISSPAEYLNRDLRPVGLFYGLSYWNALFSPRLARVMALVGRLRLWMLVPLVLGSVLLFLVMVKRTGKGQAVVVPVVIATTGFAGMTADLVIIFAFQCLYGYVYHWIGLLITAFMAGLALGGSFMNRTLARASHGLPALLRLDAALVLFGVLLPIVLGPLYACVTQPFLVASIQGLLFCLNALAGFLVGAQFPLGNQIWLAGRESQRGTTGVLYASDLLGAFVGSVLVTVVLVPVIGIVGTCLVVVTLKLGSLLLGLTLVRRC